jgi:hypothetical protein
MNATIEGEEPVKCSQYAETVNLVVSEICLLARTRVVFLVK